MPPGATEKKHAYLPIHCTRSDGAAYDYGTGYDERTKTRPCEDPAIDLRWRIHLAGYLKRELTAGTDSKCTSSVGIPKLDGNLFSFLCRRVD